MKKEDLKSACRKQKPDILGETKKRTDSCAAWEPRNKLREKAKASKKTRHRIQKNGIAVKGDHNLKDNEKS